MAKITYYLGARASYFACPILEKQAKMMIALVQFELKHEINEYGDKACLYRFDDKETSKLPDNNRIKIFSLSFK